MNVPFRPFGKIARLNREVVVTEKIDGTNGLVHVSDSGIVTAGSRNRWLASDDDNHGFARWVADRSVELAQLGPGYHYGEWWGRGIQRGYELDEKRFSLFNISRWGDGERSIGCAKCNLVASTWAPATCERCRSPRPAEPPKRPACCGVVPIVARGFDICETTNRALTLLRLHGSFAAPGYRNPEGVIAWHSASGHSYKVTLENDDEPKRGRR